MKLFKFLLFFALVAGLASGIPLLTLYVLHLVVKSVEMSLLNYLLITAILGFLFLEVLKFTNRFPFDA